MTSSLEELALQYKMTEKESQIELLHQSADNFMCNTTVDTIDPQEKFTKCKEIYTQIIDISSDDYLANFNLGVLYFTNYKTSSIPDFDLLHTALEYLQKAEKSDRNSSVLFNIALVETELGNIENAMKTYQEILDLNQQYDDECIQEDIKAQNQIIYNNLALLAKNQDNMYQAIKYYKEGLMLDPKNFIFLYNISLIFIKSGKYSQATKFLNKAILYPGEHKPNVAYKILAEAYEKLGKYDEALKTYLSLETLEGSTKDLSQKITRIENIILSDDKFSLSENEEKKTCKSIKFKDHEKDSKFSKALEAICSTDTIKFSEEEKHKELLSNIDEIKEKILDNESNMLICINPPDTSEKESDSKHYENWSQDKCNDILISQSKNKYAYFRLGCLNLATNPIKARACLKECQEIDPKFRPGDCIELIADSIINDEKKENADALPFYEQAGKTSPDKISVLVKLHRL